MSRSPRTAVSPRWRSRSPPDPTVPRSLNYMGRRRSRWQFVRHRDAAPALTQWPGDQPLPSVHREGVVAAAVAAPPGPGRQKSRPRAWLVAVVVTWGLLLAGGIGLAVSRGGPTDREQTTVAEALPTVDQAAERVVDA